MKHTVFILFSIVTLHLEAQQIRPLYPAAIPNSKPYPMKEIAMENEGQFWGYRSISEPTLAVYLPDQKIATGAAVIICPGGGYGMESYRLDSINHISRMKKSGII